MRWYSKLLLFIRTAYWWMVNRQFLLWHYRTVHYQIMFEDYAVVDSQYRVLEKVRQARLFEVDCWDSGRQLIKHVRFTSRLMTGDYALVF